MNKKTKTTLLRKPRAEYPADIDKYVGEKFREFRVQTGATQENVAKVLKLSYQQVQKYETGANRISAGRLWQMCELFDRSPADFFEGFDPGKPAEPIAHGGRERSTIELIQNYTSLKSPELRTAICGLLRSLADAD